MLPTTDWHMDPMLAALAGPATRRGAAHRQERQLMAKWDEDPIPEERESLCVSGMKVAPDAREQQAGASKREG